MNLSFMGKGKSRGGMELCQEMMHAYFKDTIVLVKHWGPVQMCVFYLEYDYLINNYKIILECERGFLTIKVINQDGYIFSPWMIYPEADYYHFEDVEEDIFQLISLTHIAITKNEITFVDPNIVVHY